MQPEPTLISIPGILAAQSWQPDEGALERLGSLLRNSAPVLVLTGAGCSTESGIPDYRDRHGEWKRPRPLELRQFLTCKEERRRYWARSMLGWPRIADARPNRAHHALARLQRLGCIAAPITQNVDALHQQAGSTDVIDLHGRLDAVECLDCGMRLSRAYCQLELERLNPHWRATTAVAAPDGDAEPDAASCAGFRVPGCPGCGGLLKPGVVFFGESVPRERVTRAMLRLEAAGALLVIGSSLMVASGYRFVHAAGKRGIPVVLLNLGRTRADSEANFKLSAHCGAVLSALLWRLKPG